MIRLAILGLGESQRREVAIRLREAMVVDAVDNADAIAFVGEDPLSEDEVSTLFARGRSVLVTAGAAVTEPILVRWLDASRKAGVPWTVVNPERFRPSRRLIRQQLDAGRLGEVGLLRRHRWRPRTNSDESTSSAWPGDLLRDLDIILWLAGHAPNRAFALQQPSAGDAASRSTYLQVHLGFPGDAMALLDFTDRLPTGSGYESLSVIGSAGSAIADDHQNVQLLFRGGEPQAIRTGEGFQPLALMLQDFVDGLQARRDFTATVTEWRRVLLVANAIQQSIAAYQAIEVPTTEACHA